MKRMNTRASDKTAKKDSHNSNSNSKSNSKRSRNSRSRSTPEQNEYVRRDIPKGCYGVVISEQLPYVNDLKVSKSEI